MGGGCAASASFFERPCFCYSVNFVRNQSDIYKNGACEGSKIIMRPWCVSGMSWAALGSETEQWRTVFENMMLFWRHSLPFWTELDFEGSQRLIVSEEINLTYRTMRSRTAS